MKLYLYDGLDGNGKATYQSIEIDEQEAAAWVQVDFERQQKEKGDLATPRTAQQILNEMNNDDYNSDRRYRYLQDRKQTVKADEGFDGEAEVDRLNLIPDDTYNPEKILQSLESQQEAESILAELFSSITKIQKRRARAYFMEHKTMQEIANEEGVDDNAVNKSIQTVRRILKKIIEKY